MRSDLELRILEMVQVGEADQLRRVLVGDVSQNKDIIVDAWLVACRKSPPDEAVLEVLWEQGDVRRFWFAELIQEPRGIQWENIVPWVMSQFPQSERREKATSILEDCAKNMTKVVQYGRGKAAGPIAITHFVLEGDYGVDPAMYDPEHGHWIEAARTYPTAQWPHRLGLDLTQGLYYEFRKEQRFDAWMTPDISGQTLLDKWRQGHPDNDSAYQALVALDAETLGHAQDWIQKWIPGPEYKFSGSPLEVWTNDVFMGREINCNPFDHPYFVGVDTKTHKSAGVIRHAQYIKEYLTRSDTWRLISQGMDFIHENLTRGGRVVSKESMPTYQRREMLPTPPSPAATWLRQAREDNRAVLNQKNDLLPQLQKFLMDPRAIGLLRYIPTNTIANWCMADEGWRTWRSPENLSVVAMKVLRTHDKKIGFDQLLCLVESMPEVLATPSAEAVISEFDLDEMSKRWLVAEVKSALLAKVAHQIRERQPSERQPKM